MKTEQILKKELKPLLEMVRSAKLIYNKEFLNNVEDFKKFLIENNICEVNEYPLLLDKIFDELIKEN